MISISIDRLTKIFLDLVQIDSPTGSEGAVADYIIDFLAVEKISSHKDSFGNVYAFVPGEGDPLVLCSHMDVVQPCIGVKPKIENGYIVTDGTTVLGGDNKVAVAAILECVRAARESGATLRPLDLVFTCSEEIGNEGAIHFDYSLLHGREGYSFDSGVAFGTIITGSPFYERFDVEFIGVGTHASRPETGNNALAMLRDALVKIPLGRPTETMTCNVGIVESGKARNAVPGNAILRGEVRSYKEDEIIATIAEIARVCEAAASAHGGSAKIETVRENGGFLHEQTHPLVAKVAAKISSVGLTPIYQNVFGCFDANIFIEHDVTLINISPGVEFAHGTGERMSIENLEKLGNIVLELAKK
ncbi:MAG: M20/M25/M40 family metallo-hydrolase [Candidatus Magasanikbacteria bacterium]|nr:M20/M25/M40 family metallo-hydrolase [Candidatus Magasanikbacteria bacterium]